MVDLKKKTLNKMLMLKIIFKNLCRQVGSLLHNEYNRFLTPVHWSSRTGVYALLVQWVRGFVCVCVCVTNTTKPVLHTRAVLDLLLN